MIEPNCLDLTLKEQTELLGLNRMLAAEINGGESPE